VQTSLGNYIYSNFSHKFLGGAASTLDYTAQAGGYNCTNIDLVYQLAKCSDIVTDDRFWKFSELINPDPRLLPQACTVGTQVTQQKIDLAENKNFQYVNFDRVASYNNLLKLGAPCAAPIPTGLTISASNRTIDTMGNVNITGTNTYRDMVCPNPACSYNRGGNSCIP
jgi:hypothetical protein